MPEASCKPWKQPGETSSGCKKITGTRGKVSLVTGMLFILPSTDGHVVLGGATSTQSQPLQQKKSFSSKHMGGGNTEPAGGARWHWSKEEGGAEPVSGTFVNTRGERKRNDLFDLPALCSRSHWVPQRDLSPCSHTAAPWGAKKRVFPPRRRVGQPKPLGDEWTPLKQRALDGSQQSTGWLWKPGIPGQQRHHVCATTPWPLLDLWQDGHLHKGHSCRALLHSVLCQQGAVGGSASQQDRTPWSPRAQCSYPRKGFLALSLQLPWELVRFVQHQGPIPAWEGVTKRGQAWYQSGI